MTLPRVIPVDYGESFDLEAYRRWIRIESFQLGMQFGRASLAAEQQVDAGESFVPAGLTVAMYRELVREPLFVRYDLHLKPDCTYVTIPAIP